MTHRCEKLRALVARLGALVSALLVASILSGAAFGAAAPGPEEEPFDPAACQPRVTARLDNDIDPYFDRVESSLADPVPAAVRAKLIDLATDFLIRAGDGRTRGMTCERLLPKTFRVEVTPRRDLYVGILRDVYGYRFALILYDKDTGRAAGRPPQFSARSLRAAPLEKPYVSFADLRQSGGRQIVFQEPTHFFEVYRGVIYHYYDVGPDLELIHVMAVETRFSDRMYNFARFNRELTLLEPGRIRLQTSLTTGGEPTRPLGYVELESKKEGAPFKVVLRRALTPEFYSDLLTIDGRNPDSAISEAAEERFLRAE